MKKDFLWVLKKDFKSTESFIRLINGKKVVKPNKTLIALDKVAVVTTLGVNKNFIKIILENTGEILYAEMSIQNFLKLINDDNFRLISKNTALKLSLIENRLEYKYLMYLDIPYKVGVTYESDISNYFITKYG